jgi:PHD/YefM family antitoxin component YafN of YafNO toxin-antitoxin module
MQSVSATEFVKNFGLHNMNAQHEPIAVANPGRVTGYYISAREYEDMQKKIASLRKSYTLGTLPDELYTKIINSNPTLTLDFK